MEAPISQNGRRNAELRNKVMVTSRISGLNSYVWYLVVAYDYLIICIDLISTYSPRAFCIRPDM